MSTSGHGFLAGSFAIESLRKSGYKNVAYALGELVDNSIQEDASGVDILISEAQIPTKGGQMVWRIDEIGILDNGNGMDDERLWRALRLGDGDAKRGRTRGKAGNQMGKFGVGLPQASISQCRQVEIWSWAKGGHSNANWVTVNLNDEDWIQNENLEIREPVKKKVPKRWLKNSDIWADSGTLIVWSNLDRVNWKTSTSIFKHSEFLIGRMYRDHISSGQTEIRLKAFENKSPYHVRGRDLNNDGRIDSSEEYFWTFAANDPLYLDPNAESGNPPRNPMFEPVGEPEIIKFDIMNPETGNSEIATVELKFSMVSPISRQGHGWVPGTNGQGGSQPHGKHAAHNMGLSIVRNGRELELDAGWTTRERNAAWERWWGAEIRFESNMDHIFDVTNNKQHAQNLNDVAKKHWDDWREDDVKETLQELKERLKQEDYSMYICMTIAQRIRDNIGIMRKVISETAPKNTGKSDSRGDAEDFATAAIDARKEKGFKGESDIDEALDDEVKKAIAEADLAEAGLDKETIEEITGNIISLGYKVVFQKRAMESDAFFTVVKEVGALIVYLNTKHRAYKYLIGLLIDIEDNNELGEEALRSKVKDASTAFKILMSAWARYEDESRGEERNKLQTTRKEWGKMSHEFLGFINPEDVNDDDWNA